MSKAGKYSLWLCPLDDSSAQTHLGGIVAEYAESLGAPSFHPHVTLFSPILASSDSDALAQVREYIAKLHNELGSATLDVGIPFTARRVATGDRYYQSVFMEGQDNMILAQANNIARQHWNATAQPTFYSHSSLVYGNYTSAKREEIAAEIASKLPEDINLLSFFAPEIHVVQTEGLCDQWRDIGSIGLST
ncbi:hypothetical protein EV175_000693 [Coemansia sp. RSA 1933]|nr:hypothetical protein EV175_000693 [Coemansia sp. RSA 1933]